MLASIFGAVNGLMRVLSGLLQWFREKDIHDAGVNHEKVRQHEAQNGAVSRANRAALDPARLRDNRYKRPPRDY